MNWSSASQLVAGLVLSGRITPAAVNPMTLEPPYDQIIKLAQSGKGDADMISTIGFQPYNTSMMAAETIREQDDPGKYVKLCEDIAVRVQVGGALDKHVKKLIRGEEIQIDAALASLSRLEEERMMFETADQISPEDDIWMPTFWKAVDEFVGGVPKYGLIIIGAPPGCITGDTIIDINRGGKSFKIRLDSLVRNFNGGKTGGRLWDLSIPTMVRSRYEDGSIRLNQLASAVYSGRKEVYRLVLESGDTLRGTWDHPIMTTNGWQKLSLLKPGDLVLVDGGQSKSGRRKKPRYAEYEGLRRHPYSRNHGIHRSAVAKHRVIAEANINKMDLFLFLDLCRTGDTNNLIFLDPRTTAVHHVDGDSNNNSIDNLLVCTHEEHRRIHNWTSNCMYYTTTSAVVSVEFVGEEDTYDLSLVDEPRNFIANNMVVHNTGKTSALIKLIDSITRKRKRFLFLSLELTGELVVMRWLQIRPGLSDRQRSYLLVSDEVYTVDEAVTAISRMIAKDPDIYAVGIDFADMMVPEDIGEEVSEASKIYRKLATCAKRVRKPIFLLAQLNSNYTGGIPHANHIRYSRLAEAMAALILLLYNPDGIYIDMGKDDKKNPLTYREGKAYIILAKSRFGFKFGSPGAFAVDFYGERGWGDDGDGWTRL